MYSCAWIYFVKKKLLYYMGFIIEDCSYLIIIHVVLIYLK